MNLGKRRQAGRTPNASRSPGRSATARERLECVELAPAFARGSWRVVSEQDEFQLARAARAGNCSRSKRLNTAFAARALAPGSPSDRTARANFIFRARRRS